MKRSGELKAPGLATVAAALIFLLALACMLPALGGGFLIWDDNVNLLDNPSLWQPAGDALRWMFTNIENVQRYKPLNWLAWRTLGGVFGLDPVAFHALNVLLHALNGWLLFRVTHTFLVSGESPSTPKPTAAILSAFAGALWWAVHPLRVEPVAWISGAGYPLATFFSLLSIRAFQRHLQSGHQRFHWYAVGLFGLSLLSYPAAASLPALLLALALLAPSSGKSTATNDLGRLARLLAPYATMAIILLGATLLTRIGTSGETWNQPASLAAVGPGTRLMQAPAVWMWYLEKTLLPLHLSPVYPDLWTFSPAGLRALVSVAAIVLLSAGAWRVRRRFPETPVFWGAWLLLAVPVLGITDLPFSPADRYTYVPGLALALLLAAWVYRGVGLATSFGRNASIGAGAIVLSAGLAATVAQLQIWRTPVAFFSNAIARVEPHPAAADLHWRLGLHFLTMNDPASAEKEFAETLRLNPRHADAARYLRVLRNRAERTIERAKEVKPKDTP